MLRAAQLWPGSAVPALPDPMVARVGPVAVEEPDGGRATASGGACQPRSAAAR